MNLSTTTKIESYTMPPLLLGGNPVIKSIVNSCHGPFGNSNVYSSVVLRLLRDVALVFAP